MAENRESSGYGGRRGFSGRDWTKGNITKNLLILGWPMSVSSVLTVIGPVIDMFWIGRLGEAALAGVGVAATAVMVVNSIRMGLQAGTQAMIARFVGAGNNEGANHVGQQVLVVSVAFSIIFAFIGIILAEPIMRVIGVEENVVAEGAAYMRIMFGASISMSLRMMAESIMQASGDSVTPMVSSVILRLLHIFLCPFLIFGWGILPQMGVSGAATANVVSQSVAGAIGLWAVFSGWSIVFERTRWRQGIEERNFGIIGRIFGFIAIWRFVRIRPSRLTLSLRNFSFNWNIIWRIVRIGIPASITGMGRSFANLLLVVVVSPFGTIAVAAHSLIQRVVQFAQMAGMGLGRGAGVLAGHNLGAQQPGRAERTGWIAAGLYTVLMAVMSLVAFFLAEEIIGLFSSDTDAVALGSDFLRIEIVGLMVFGFVAVLSQCLNGVGETVIPMLNTSITMWLIQLPLAYFLSNYTSLGVYGVRWGVVAAVVIRGGVYFLYFKSGRWKRKKV